MFEFTPHLSPAVREKFGSFALRKSSGSSGDVKARFAFDERGDDSRRRTETRWIVIASDESTRSDDSVDTTVRRLADVTIRFMYIPSPIHDAATIEGVRIINEVYEDLVIPKGEFRMAEEIVSYKPIVIRYEWVDVSSGGEGGRKEEDVIYGLGITLWIMLIWTGVLFFRTCVAFE